MLDVTVVAIGKPKDASCREIFEEYAKRLRPYARLKVIELSPAPFSD